MQSLDALNLLPVWVNPEHLVATARILMAGHRLKVLGVVEGAELVGIITSTDLERASDSAKVVEFMREPTWVVEASTPLRQLAETFYDEDLDYLPVVQDSRFRGMVTPNMLLREMARSWDPLTGLSWSDRLREWGVGKLKEGREITILFIDLDDFGSYNKKYGHIVGDRVLQRVADMIGARIDSASDQLVRYGGDEFAVGTVRDQEQAMHLARSLHEGMSRVRVAGSDEPVTFSIGIQGGKRTKERENVHYAATLDNLINLASKNSMAEKVAKKGGAMPDGNDHDLDTVVSSVPSEELDVETAPDPVEIEQAPFADHVEPDSGEEITAAAMPTQPDPVQAVAEEHEIESGPLRIIDVVADAADANSVTQVTIETGIVKITGVCPRKGGSMLKSVALATANAISQLDPSVKIEIGELKLTESESGVRFISVAGNAEVDGQDRSISGVGTVGRNLYVAVAEATLQSYTSFEAVR